MNIVVIGANHAGTAAINTILDNYPDEKVIIFDQNNNISFLGCGMALWIGHQISGPGGLFYASPDQFQQKGATVHLETSVESIDFAKKVVHAVEKDGTAIDQPYDKLILATGSLPIQPKLPGMDLDNVQFVKLFQDAETVVKKLTDPDIKDVTVVGAGYIGVELAEAFVRNGRKCRLIDCAETCLSGYYDRDFCDRMAENLSSHGLELCFGQTVTAIEGKDGKVCRAVTDKGSYDTDMVVFAIGFKPNTALGADHLELMRGAYHVNRCQCTSDPDVYAVGDCATIYNNAKRADDYIALATNAVRSGILAAHNACGTKLESPGVQGSNGISIWGLNLFSTGLTLQKAKDCGFNAKSTEYTDWQKASFIESGNTKTTCRIVYDADSREILGAQLISDYDISMGLHMFSLAIQEHITIDKLKLLDIFFLPHFNQPYNYITMAALGAE
ncbi:MAG: H2O-forming NADH oxidase [Acutalibacter sp.]